MAEIAVRRETPDDYRAAEHLTRDAFWNRYKPGCDEHLILHKMRDLPAFVKDLDLVAADASPRRRGQPPTPADARTDQHQHRLDPGTRLKTRAGPGWLTEGRLYGSLATCAADSHPPHRLFGPSSTGTQHQTTPDPHR